MSNSDLLKEAIADARAVKETAIANAKLALEEAFTPRIQSMISSRLEEEGEEEFGDEEEMPMDGEMDMEMEPGMEAGEDRELNLGGQAYHVDNAGEALPGEEMPMDDEMGMEEEPVDEYDLSEILRQLDEDEYELNNKSSAAPLTIKPTSRLHLISSYSNPAQEELKYAIVSA
jgi:hypothetical protein